MATFGKIKWEIGDIESEHGVLVMNRWKYWGVEQWIPHAFEGPILASAENARQNGGQNVKYMTSIPTAVKIYMKTVRRMYSNIPYLQTLGSDSPE